MALTTLTGEDVFIINDKPLMLDTANGDIVTIDYPNDLVTMTTGKNTNTIYAKNEAGSQVDVVCKVMRGSQTDKDLNGLMSQQERDFVGFTLMNGAFVKRLGNGEGKVTYDTYSLTGMVFTKKSGAKANTDGDGDQATVTYTMKAALATRGIL
mgnify:CR=1 FL=1